MNQFVRFVFLLVILSSAMGFALVLVSSMRAEKDREGRIADEDRAIDQFYKRVNGQTAYAYFFVERQEESLDADTKRKVVSRTTLLFGLSNSAAAPPTYVQRIELNGSKVTIDAIRLSFDKGFDGGGSLLAGRSFNLFDKVTGEPGKPLEAEKPAEPAVPFELNPVGYPPLGLRHNLPDFTEYDKELWRPVWDILVANPERMKELGVTKSMTSVVITAKPETLYKLQLVGDTINPEVMDSDHRPQDMFDIIVGKTDKPGMLTLAAKQDKEERTGIKEPR